jgi:pimeloyl-ACP methyl ester carboxylesterase
MAEYEDRYWTSSDGLRLHFRYFDGDSSKPPVICLPGLTRNARDFEDLAARLAGNWRVLCPEMRGRGDSDYAKDPMTYTPMHYLQDVETLLAQEGIERFVSIGTSLGGLLTMLLAAANPQRIAAAVLNDVGPEVSEKGLERIRGNLDARRPRASGKQLRCLPRLGHHPMAPLCQAHHGPGYRRTHRLRL